MGDHDYDEGLVHGHMWAREPFRRGVDIRETRVRVRDTPAIADDCYDDGLVHNHAWARND